MVFLRVLSLAVLAESLVLERKIQGLRINEEMCRNLTEEPVFNNDLVVGPTWRIYYAWNMMMGNQCMDLIFKNVSNSTIQRFRDDIAIYMETEVDWGNATLVMTMDGVREMLLIPEDNSPNGWFLGVPNVLKGGYLGATQGKVRFNKLAIKLFNDSRYLLVGDCENGVVSFFVRRDQKHTWEEITSAVANFDKKFHDKGYPACKFNMRKKSRRYKNEE